MYQQFAIESTLIGWMPIPPGESATRRRRERSVAAEIVRRMAGAEAVIGHDQYGAPILPGWHISVTHSRELAAVALDKTRPIGIDAEEWRPALRRVATRFLTPEEQERLTSEADLLRAWTVKEAVYKAANRYGMLLTDIATDGDEATTGEGVFAINSQFVTPTTLLTLATPKKHF